MKIKQARCRALIGSAICSFLLAGPAVEAGSYTVSIPAYTDFPLAWSFQAKTVGQAFPSPDEGTILYFWNVSSQNYTSVSYEFGAWSNPNFTIQNGVGFYYRNPLGTTKVLTVSGTDLTASSVTINLDAGKLYFLGSAYLQAPTAENFIECVYEFSSGAYRYPSMSLNYHSNLGDVIYTSALYAGGTGWTGGIRSTNCNVGTPFWGLLGSTNPCDWANGTLNSPQVMRGYGFFLQPAANTSWTQYPTQPSCPN